MAAFHLRYDVFGCELHFDHHSGSTGRADRTWGPLVRRWPPDWHNPRWRREIARQAEKAVYQIDPTSLGFR